MTAVFRKPGRPLSDFVHLLWLYEGYAPGHARERIMPDASSTLLINLDANEFRMPVEPWGQPGFRRVRGTMAGGPYSRFFVIDTSQPLHIAGVHFHPGGAFPFFRMPLEEMRDQHIGLEDLWGAGAEELRDRILDAPSAPQRLRVLDEILVERLRRSEERHPAVAFAMRELGLDSRAGRVAEVSERMGFCQRRFQQLFRDQVGLTPKRYARVQRFQSILRYVDAAAEIDWTEIALDYGYFDQAHFIHDFRDFSGLTPRDYLARRTEHMNHVPLED